MGATISSRDQCCFSARLLRARRRARAAARRKRTEKHDPAPAFCERLLQSSANKPVPSSSKEYARASPTSSGATRDASVREVLAEPMARCENVMRYTKRVTREKKRYGPSGQFNDDASNRKGASSVRVCINPRSKNADDAHKKETT